MCTRQSSDAVRITGYLWQGKAPSMLEHLINVTFCTSNIGNGESEAEAQAWESGVGFQTTLFTINPTWSQIVCCKFCIIGSVLSILQMGKLNFRVIGKGHTDYKWILNPGCFVYINTIAFKHVTTESIGFCEIQ